MNKSLLFILLIMATTGYSQTSVLPFDFESMPVTADFIDFDGGTATVLANPQAVAPNTSAKVAQIVRNGGMVWAGSKVILANNLDFSSKTSFSMKVFSPVAGIVVKFKLEGTANAERDAMTTVANQWETLTWDFTGEPANTFNTLVFMFDYGNVGNGSANSTFLFDDVTQFDPSGGLAQIDLPVSFDDPTVFYGLTDFEGASTVLGTDPTGGSNRVAISSKLNDSSPSAGTTIGTPAGFANAIPITASETKMSVRVYVPAAGMAVRLKIEDHTDPTKSVETQTQSTVGNAWEVLEFDFSNEAIGTAPLNLAYTYDMASIFFNFGVNGTSDGDNVYYWDDVTFGELIIKVEELTQLGFNYYPNPVRDNLNIRADQRIDEVRISNQLGQQVLLSQTGLDNQILDLSGLSPGVYLMNIKIGDVSGTYKVLKVERN